MILTLFRSAKRKEVEVDFVLAIEHAVSRVERKVTIDEEGNFDERNLCCPHEANLISEGQEVVVCLFFC